MILAFSLLGFGAITRLRGLFLGQTRVFVASCDRISHENDLVELTRP